MIKNIPKRKIGQISIQLSELGLGCAPIGDNSNSIISSVTPGPRTKRGLLKILDWYQTKIPNEFWSAVKNSGLLHEQAPVPNLI